MVNIGLDMKMANGDARFIPLGKPRMTVGRQAQSDIRIPLPSVAPQHCELHWDGTALWCRDTTSGDLETRRNGTPISDSKLLEGDELQIGSVRFIVRRIDSLTGSRVQMISEAILDDD